MIYIDKTRTSSIYQQIYDQLASQIMQDVLKAGTKLPATRKLAEDLGISRNTVNKAYQQLLAEGYLISKEGSGYFVNNLPHPIHGKVVSHHLAPKRSTTPSPKYDLNYGCMSGDVFPHKSWRKCLNHALDYLSSAQTLSYPDHHGEPQLREAIAEYISQSRGVICDANQIIITSGLQYSMELIAHIFGHTSKVIAVDNPSYDGIRPIFKNHGFQICGLPVLPSGWDINSLEQTKADLVYLTPSHQFPTGMVLPVSKRLELLNLAQKRNMYLLEDDYDGELRYSTNPIPSMHSLDREQRVIYLGTFSKSFGPNIRTAFIVFPHALMQKYQDMFERYHCQVPTINQLALAEFITSGEYAKHINRLCTEYKKRMQDFKQLVHEIFQDKVHLHGGEAGIHFLMDVISDSSTEDLIRSAQSIGLRLYSSKPLYLDDAYENLAHPQLLVGLPTLDLPSIRPVLEQLKTLWFSHETS